MPGATQATPPDQPEFRNPYRGRRRAMLIFGGACLLVAAASGVLLAGGRFDMQSRAGTSVAVALMLGIVGTVAMLALAFAMSFVVRATDRVFDRFRRGEMLADWRFAPEEWDAFVAVERARYAKGRWGIPLFVVVPAGLVGVIVVVSLAPGGAARILGLVLVAAAGAALYWGLARIGAGMSRRRVELLRRNPRVMIGNGAIWCGGTLTQWNYGGTLLQSIRTIPGSPMRLEVMTGAGAKPNSGKYDFTTLLQIPVPAGKEDDAARVVQTLRK